MKTMNRYEELYNDLRNLGLDYFANNYHGTDDDSVEWAEQDEVLQSVDTLCDYLEELF